MSRGRVVPCGKCFSCRSKRRSQWSARLREESRFHLSQGNLCLFLTLTYNEENVPRTSDGTRVARIAEFSSFIKRLRKKLYGSKRGSLRYFGVSEYGPTTLRPHYHAILFGFPHLPLKRVNQILADCWTSGYISVSICNNRTIAYCTKYCLMDFVLTGIYAASENRPQLRCSKGLGKVFITHPARVQWIRSGQFTYRFPEGYCCRLPRYWLTKVFTDTERWCYTLEYAARKEADFRRQEREWLDLVESVGKEDYMLFAESLYRESPYYKKSRELESDRNIARSRQQQMIKKCKL
nr:MAG: replication associated protein [Microviridae sp.]